MNSHARGSASSLKEMTPLPSNHLQRGTRSAVRGAEFSPGLLAQNRDSSRMPSSEMGQDSERSTDYWRTNHIQPHSKTNQGGSNTEVTTYSILRNLLTSFATFMFMQFADAFTESNDRDQRLTTANGARGLMLKSLILLSVGFDPANC